MLGSSQFSFLFVAGGGIVVLHWTPSNFDSKAQVGPSLGPSSSPSGAYLPVVPDSLDGSSLLTALGDNTRCCGEWSCIETLRHCSADAGGESKIAGSPVAIS